MADAVLSEGRYRVDRSIGGFDGAAGLSVRYFLGFVLLGAAALKSFQLVTEPFLVSELLGARWPLVVLVEIELFLGLWLILGVWPRWSRLTALGCFSVFAVVSLYLAVSGSASCGCFGSLAVNPWLTFMFDLGAIAALSLWRPTMEATSTEYVCRRRAFQLAIASLLIGVPAGVAMARFPAVTAALLGSDELVVVEPSDWVGQTFPLANHIEGGMPLARGTWLVLFYHHSCPACVDAVEKYQQLGTEFSGHRGRPRIAIVECPPYESDNHAATCDTVVCGRMSDSKRWKLPTPVTILIEEGRVQHVFENARDIDLIRGIWGKS